MSCSRKSILDLTEVLQLTLNQWSVTGVERHPGAYEWGGQVHRRRATRHVLRAHTLRNDRDRLAPPASASSATDRLRCPPGERSSAVSPSSTATPAPWTCPPHHPTSPRETPSTCSTTLRPRWSRRRVGVRHVVESEPPHTDSPPISFLNVSRPTDPRIWD